MTRKTVWASLVGVGLVAVAATGFWRADASVGTGIRYSELPTHAALKAALTEARQADNGGFDLDMWATVVDRDGIVRAVGPTPSACPVSRSPRRTSSLPSSRAAASSAYSSATP
jgi:hypothetical protein